jgi:hypothetical protein
VTGNQAPPAQAALPAPRPAAAHSHDPAGDHAIDRRPVTHSWRRILHSGIVILASAGLVATVATASASASPRSAAPAAETPVARPYFSVAENYTIRYYPRFLTYVQQSLGGFNRLAGPNRVSPLYGFVVSINVDTLYASFFADLSQGPEIFTIPQTGVTYSLLTLDVFGDVFNTNIQPQTAGTYGLVPAGWKGTLPPGVTKVVVPYPVTTWIIRADKYSSSNQNLTAQATAFRASLRLAPLATYEKDPSAGATKIVPEAAFALRMKAVADDAVRFSTTHFFRVVQAALRSPNTAPLSRSDLQLSAAFNRLFAAANAAARHGNSGPLSLMIQGARTAHTTIIGRWLSHADANKWIYFSNFANWGTAYLDRAAGNEYIQFGNNTSAAGYYNAFTDGSGAPLNGSVHAYRLTFSKNQIPQAKRFWSLTAYLPRGNTLVPNAAGKYEVARFTPGLVTNPDGSITIYMQATPPAAALRPNWLPVPRGPFDVLLRVYGPEGNTSPGTNYIPPKIQP